MPILWYYIESKNSKRFAKKGTSVSANTSKDLVPNLPSTLKLTLEMTRLFVGKIVLLGHASELTNPADRTKNPLVDEEIQAVTIQALQVRSVQSIYYTQSFSVYLEPAGNLCFLHGTIDHIEVNPNDLGKATVNFQKSKDGQRNDSVVVILTIVSNEEEI